MRETNVPAALPISERVRRIDELVAASLEELAKDVLGTSWCGKERDWVNRFALGHLVNRVSRTGVLRDLRQMGIEIAVPQPPGYAKRSVPRDLVIWSRPGSTCWDAEWRPVHHPMAIVEWKVHRPGHRNRDQEHEHQWLRDYTQWQRDVVAYAVEVNLGCTPRSLTCDRFTAGRQEKEWLRVPVC